MANLRAKDFEPGKPKILAFKAAGSTVDGQYGPQVRWNTTTGDSVYLDPEPADEITRELQALGIAYGEEFRLGKTRTSHGGQRFIVERAPVRDSGGHNVPERSHDASYSQEPAQRATQSNTATVAPPVITPASMKYCAAMMSMVDAMRETKTYALRCGIDMSTEDLRCLVVTAYINDCKGGR